MDQVKVNIRVQLIYLCSFRKMSSGSESDSVSTDTLPSLNVSADTTASDENRFDDEDNLFVNGSIPPYRFQPEYSKNEVDVLESNDNISDDQTDEERNRRDNTNW